MKKKYVIAKSEKQREKNLDYLAEKYEKECEEKSLLKRIWKFIISIFQVWKIRAYYFPFNEHICRLYMDEVELFYFNNCFDIRYYQIKQVYLTKKHERKLGIKLPIILSIIASLIYTALDYFFGKELGRGIILPYIDLCQTFFQLLIENQDKQINWSVFIQIVLLFALFFVLIIVIILFVFWVVDVAINALVTILGGMNFTKKVVEEYEIDFLKKISMGNEYIELIEMLDLYEKKFYDIVCTLSFNYLIINQKEYETIDNIEKEIEKTLLINPMWCILDDKLNVICDKKIWIKSLIHRVFLQVNSRCEKLELKEDRMYLRNSIIAEKK